MTTRILPRAEWPQLAGTLLEQTWPLLPAETQIVVVERDGVIVACSALFPQWHQEGTWMAEAVRGHAGIGRALVAGMKSAMEDVGVTEVCMLATTPETERLIEKFGDAMKLDAAHYVVKVGA